MIEKDYDIAIIGAGVIGCSIARELSRLDARTVVLEKMEDVCTGTSKANSGIVHAGFDAANGSIMARMNLEGSRLMKQVCRDLDVPYRQNGALVLCFDQQSLTGLHELYQRGLANGVKELEIVDHARLHELEPSVSDEAIAALYAPTSAIVDPFLLTVGMAENAADNGVDFLFDTPVQSIRKEQDGWVLESDEAIIKAPVVINAAGVYADRIHNRILPEKSLHITPRRGSYLLLDKTAHPAIQHTIFQMPTALGKGVLVTPTCHGNILVGPTSVDIEDKEGINTTANELNKIMTTARISIPALETGKVITSFAGLRAHEDKHDFHIGKVRDSFYEAAGIESPGLSSAPAIGLALYEMIKEKEGFKDKACFNPTRKGIINPADLSIEERNDLIARNPAYGTIICRCESISQGEIEEALHRSIPAGTLDGIKRRVRAGMGRCQGGFCMPKVMDIIAKERKIPANEVCKGSADSRILTGFDKEDL